MTSATEFTHDVAAPTVADLLRQLGDIPPQRVRLSPLLGLATEEDLIQLNAQKTSRWELVDSVLVELPTSLLEARLGVTLGWKLSNWLEGKRLGALFSTSAMYRLVSHNIRLPDISFVEAVHFPNGRVERLTIADVPFALAVEILSVSNTAAEMERKRAEYFENGTRLMWIVDPATHTVTVHTKNAPSQTLTEIDTLTGGDVLPGFELSIRDCFRRAEEL